MYRVRGHLIANLDPLGLKEPRTHAELDPINWGLTIWDLDRDFPTGGVAGKRVMRLRDILGVLRDAYSRTIGVEYMHIQEPDEKAWIQRQVEGVHVDATRGREARDPRVAQRGRSVRTLPAHEVPRAEALQPRRRGDAHPDAAVPPRRGRRRRAWRRS